MTPQKVLALYERGVFATGEMCSRLCSLAADHNPATFSDQVPPELLADIRERSALIPHPGELIRMGSYCGVEPPDPVEEAAREKAETERYIAGLRTWKAYFESVGQTISPIGEQP